MKIKNLSKLLPLALLFSITACNSSLITKKAAFMDEDVEIILPSEKGGYVETAQRILKEIEKYADPNYVAKTLEKYRLNVKDSDGRKYYYFTGDYTLYEMIHSLAYYSRGYLPYDNGYIGMWKKVIEEGRTDFDDDSGEYYEAYRLYDQLLNADFQFSSWGEMTYIGNFTFDFRPVIEAYAIDKVRAYFGSDYWNGRVTDYILKMSPYNMAVVSTGNKKSITLDGPYGKKVTINGLEHALISMASGVGNTRMIQDKYGYTRIASTKYITMDGPWVKNDAVIMVTCHLGDNRGITPAIYGAAYAYEAMKEEEGYNRYREGEEGIYAIVFRNNEIVYCSSKLDVKYEGVYYGTHQYE